MGTMTKLWDNYKELGIVKKTAKIRLIVYVATKDGVRNVGIQEQVYKTKLGEWRNTYHSIVMPLLWPDGNCTAFADVMKLLSPAAALAEDLELEDELNEVWYERKNFNDR